MPRRRRLLCIRFGEPGDVSDVVPFSWHDFLGTTSLYDFDFLVRLPWNLGLTYPDAPYNLDGSLGFAVNQKSGYC